MFVVGVLMVCVCKEAVVVEEFVSVVLVLMAGYWGVGVDNGGSDVLIVVATVGVAVAGRGSRQGVIVPVGVVVVVVVLEVVVVVVAVRRGNSWGRSVSCW